MPRGCHPGSSRRPGSVLWADLAAADNDGEKEDMRESARVTRRTKGAKDEVKEA